MFTGKQFGVLGVIVGANLLLSLLVSTIGGSLGAQGPTGQTGPQGPQGSSGPAGEIGEDGREVEFQVANNVLQWRYIGDATWNALDLEISGGGDTTLSTGGDGFFGHWIHRFEQTIQYETPVPTEIANSTTYANNLVTNEGYVGVANLEDFLAIDNDPQGKYVLLNDLDLSTWVPNGNFTVINNEFTGIFDGAGFSISNYNVESLDGGISSGGLFSLVDGATIRNLDLVDFSVKAQLEMDGVGALVSRIDNDDLALNLFQNITLTGFDVVNLGDGSIEYSGGLIGNLDEENKIRFENIDISEVRIETDGYMYANGGLFGYADGHQTLEIIGVSVESFIGNRIPDTTAENSKNQIGGVGGFYRGYSDIFVYDVNVDFIGDASYRSGGFFGQLGGENNLVVSHADINVNLGQSISNSGNEIGGFTGFFGRDVTMIMDHVSITGSLEGEHEIGGLFGYTNQASYVSLDTISIDINIAGIYELGGLVGAMYDDYANQWNVKNVDVIVDVTLNSTSSNIYAYEIGGLIGIVESSDSMNPSEAKQLSFDGVNVELNLDFIMNEQETASSYYLEAYNIGGAIGDLEDNNQIRIANATFVTNTSMTFNDSTTANDFEFVSNNVGGVIGYAEASNVLLVNVDATLESLYEIDGFTAPESSSGSLNIDIYDYGAMIGDIDEQMSLVFVESSFTFNLTSIFRNLDEASHDLDLSIDDVGGLVGEKNSSSFLQGKNADVTFNLTVIGENLTTNPDRTILIDLTSIGTLLGVAEGVSLFDNVAVNAIDSSFTATLPVDNVIAQITNEFNINKKYGSSGFLVFAN